MRQALGFGILSSVVGFAALLWPLLVSLVASNVVATLWIYGIAMLADLVLLAMWVLLAARYSQRAGRGELFEVPWVARLTGTSVRK